MAVDAMREGAYDFLAKPYRRALVASSGVRSSGAARAMENRRLRARLDAAIEADPAVLGSPAIGG